MNWELILLDLSGQNVVRIAYHSFYYAQLINKHSECLFCNWVGNQQGLVV